MPARPVRRPGEHRPRWLRGPRGAHTCEVVFQLLGRAAAREPVPRRTTGLLHLPGGDWRYAKLYGPSLLHGALALRAGRAGAGR